jgi:hypothetical protein
MRLHHLRFRNSERVERGLQTTIVQQSDLHGGISRQRFAQERSDARGHLLCLIGGADRHDVLAQFAIRNRSNERHAAIGGEALATGDEQCRRQNEGERGRISFARAHGLFAFGCGVMRSFCSRHGKGVTGRCRSYAPRLD